MIAAWWPMGNEATRGKWVPGRDFSPGGDCKHVHREPSLQKGGGEFCLIKREILKRRVPAVHTPITSAVFPVL